MAQILVRNLDERVVNRLKVRARRNGRSLQAEVRAILEQAPTLDMPSARKLADTIRKSLGHRRFDDSAVLIRRERDRR
ncbi:MAG: FitA-like ribbon-helix-helix domain-containing protein [Terriglobia bacterium]